MKQLTNDEMRQVLSDWIDDTDASAKTRRNIVGLFEAVIIRAEAAEAEVMKLRRELELREREIAERDENIARLRKNVIASKAELKRVKEN